jgi:MerR family transcriptional regulator/heat shock protein HspR
VKYLRLDEVRERFGIDRQELERLAREGLIRIKRTLEDEAVVSELDADTARVAVMLMNELEVNLPGAEVIVHMRSEMLAMRRQFDRILEELVDELRRGPR